MTTMQPVEAPTASLDRETNATPALWMIIPTFYPVVGGAQSQTRRISNRLIEQGWSVQVLTTRHNYAHPDGLPARAMVDRIPVNRLYSRGKSKIGSLLYVLGGLWYLLRHGRRGIYHAHAIGSTGWLAVVAKYLHKGKALIKLRTGRNYYEQRFGSGMARWQFHALLRLADRIVVVNREVEQYVSELGVPPERVVYLPNAISTSDFQTVSEAEKRAARQRLRLPLEKNIVLFVGRLVAIKGIDVLLQAWALLPPEVRARALLVIVGDGNDRDLLMETARSLALCETVVFTGAQQHVRDFYGAADLFVLPSRAEGLSNALVEAMACGLPVVASNTGGALDLVEPEKNGLLFECEDAHELTLRLTLMFERKSHWQEMGRRSRQTVLRYADLDSIVNSLDALYRELG